MKIWNTESKKHWLSSREGMMSWTTRCNTILSVFRGILPYLPLYELLCTMESNNNLFSTNCFGLLKVKTKIWQDTHLSRSSGFPCLLATNPPPKTLYTLLSEGAVEEVSLASELCNDDSVARKKLNFYSYTFIVLADTSWFYWKISLCFQTLRDHQMMRSFNQTSIGR